MPPLGNRGQNWYIPFSINKFYSRTPLLDFAGICGTLDRGIGNGRVEHNKTQHYAKRPVISGVLVKGGGNLFLTVMGDIQNLSSFGEILFLFLHNSFLGSFHHVQPFLLPLLRASTMWLHVSPWMHWVIVFISRIPYFPWPASVFIAQVSVIYYKVGVL